MPKAPAQVAVPDVSNWMMLANGPDPTCPAYPSGVGDCGVAGLQHGMMGTAADTHEAEAFPSADEVVSYYLTYTGGQDSGVVLSQYLAYVRQRGFYGHTVAAYAPVAVHDVPTLQFTVDAYDFAYCGITVTQAMLDAFDAGQPWTAATLTGPVLGGHCVPAVGYDDQYLTVVTWGKTQQIAWPAWHQMAEEAWAVLSGELVSSGTDGHGINLAALQADLPRLDAPAPSHHHHRGLLEEAADLIRTVAASPKKDVTELLAFLASHGL